jgi:hypothetical protein
MVISDAEAKEICKVIAQLKEDIAELETRLLRGRFYSPRQGSLKGVGIRILVSAERIEKTLSTLAAKNLTKIA